MESSRIVQRFKRLDQWLGNSLPIVTPWVLVPIGFEIFAALLQGCAENSLQEVLLFVVLPASALKIFSQCYGNIVFGPTSAPSLVAALITTMAATYFANISSVMTHIFNVAFGVLCVFLATMFWRMIKSNPGRFTPDIAFASVPYHEDRSYSVKIQMDVPRAVQYVDPVRVLPSSSTSLEGKPSLRLKYCKYCSVQVERYDHHCPAIYNCVGRKNHVLFLAMLVTFIVVEVLYVGACKTYLLADSPFSELNIRLDGDLDHQIENWTWLKAVEIMRIKPWVFGTALFAFVHLLWQVPFLGFHVYCACINLTTDELEEVKLRAAHYSDRTEHIHFLWLFVTFTGRATLIYIMKHRRNQDGLVEEKNSSTHIVMGSGKILPAFSVVIEKIRTFFTPE